MTVLGSHPVPSTPYLQACDDVIAEPAGHGGDFVGQALEVCRRERVDVFVPGRGREAIARAASEFADAGVRLQISPADAMDALAAKSSGYERAAKLGVPLPAYELAEDVAGLRAAVARLRAAGHEVCLKPDMDHGGHGFRILDESAAARHALFRPPSVRVDPAVVFELLGQEETFDPLMVSEYLPGAELSIDCLSSPTGELLAALPRSKGGLEWTRQVVRDERAHEIAQMMVEGCGLRYLSNVQVRYAADPKRGPLLLEVNTRAASGLYQSCRAAGVNLPALALAMTLGEDVDVPPPRYGETVIVYNDSVPYRAR